MPPDTRLKFLLYSKLAVHKRAVNQAKANVTEWLTRVSNPYIAFSGGKDSTCVLNLVREQRPETIAVHFDADCNFPEVDIAVNNMPNCLIRKSDEPYLETLSRFNFGEDEGDFTMKSTVWNPIKRLISEFNFDGVCYGLRAAESHGRRMNAKRGAVFQYKRDDLWACQPIVKWNYNDVWAYIVSSNLNYCGTYDKMWDMPEDDQRVSYWAGETKRTYGRWAWLKRNYPDLFNLLRAKFPEAASYV